MLETPSAAMVNRGSGNAKNCFSFFGGCYYMFDLFWNGGIGSG